MSKPSAQAILEPSYDDIIRYRYHHGVNLGSVFVLEKWLTGSAFPSDAPGDHTSELACVDLCVQSMGIEATRAKFEERWNSCMDATDWDWLVYKANCTSLRLPLGYFTLGPDFCKGTPFEPFAQVYQNAWKAAKALMAEARKQNIGVLLDMHALLGGANTAEHSGTNSRQAALWGNPTNLDHSKRCIEFVANEVKSMEGVIGIELCNEAVSGAPGMYEWYDAMIDAIGKIDRSLPIYVSDGWIPNEAIAYAKRKNMVDLEATMPPSNPVIVDHHVYFCFTDQDRNESPQQVIDRVGSLLWELDGKDGNVLGTGAAQVVCGEWSCSLSEDTWAKKGTSNTKEDLTKRFGQAQSARFYQRTGGHYFWTLKMDWMDGGDWGFVAQINSGAILVPKPLVLSKADVQSRLLSAAAGKDQREQVSFDSHVIYWSRRGSGYEHEKYAQGWQQGWADASVFFNFLTKVQTSNDGFGADTIGCMDLWVRKRLGECGMTGHFVWEYETGLRRGVADFYDCAGFNA